MKLLESILITALLISCACFACIIRTADFPVQACAAIWLAALLLCTFMAVLTWHLKMDKPLKNLSCAITLAKAERQRKPEEFQELKDLQQLEQALMPFLKAQSTPPDTEFLGKMTHEIKLPLNGIIGFISNLQDTPLNQQQRQFLKIIDASSHALLHVINQILDYSKINAGKLELENVAFNLRTLAEDRMALAEQQAKSKGVTTCLVFPQEQQAIVRGDPNRLRQVLDNLLTNAVKFTPAGEVTLEINVEQVDSDDSAVAVSFAVRDTGVGIQPEVLDTLFTPYQQADPSVSRRFGGTGLGLAISASLVKLMGGTIHVRSTPERGSTFFFNLTMKTAKTEEQVRLSGNYTIKLPKNELRKKRAMLVDDTQTNLFLLETVCQNAGLPYLTATNGQEAVQLAQKHDFDLVFMDIQMPVMDGYTAIRKLRAIDHTEHAHIVALTASAYPEDVERALNAGATEFIPKPFEKNQLLMAIADALGIVPQKIFHQTDENRESEEDETVRHMHEFMRQQYQLSLSEIKMTLAQTVVDWRPLLDNLRAYVKSGNISQARQILHKLKGQLASIGLPEQAKTAALINDAITENDDANQRQAQVDDFIARLARIFKTLEQDVTIA